MGQGPGAPWRDIHNHIFELFCRDWIPDLVKEVNCMQPTSTQTLDQWEPERFKC